MGKLSSIFELISPRRRRGFPPTSWSWKTLHWIEFWQKKWRFCCDWSRTLPDQNEQCWLCPFKGGTVVMHPWRPRGSQSAKKLSFRLFSWLPLGLRGYWWWLCNKAKKTKTKKKKNSSSWADTKTQRNTSQVSLFYSFQFIFSICRSQYFISHTITKSLIFNMSSTKVTCQLWYVNYFTPFPCYISLGHLSCI